MLLCCENAFVKIVCLSNTTSSGGLREALHEVREYYADQFDKFDAYEESLLEETNISQHSVLAPASHVEAKKSKAITLRNLWSLVSPRQADRLVSRLVLQGTYLLLVLARF